MTKSDQPPRLAVVASIIDDGGGASGPLVSAARLGSEIHDKAESAALAEPTPQERALAEALDDDTREGQQADRAIAELLLLVDDVPTADDLAAGLSHTFLLPDDSRPALARELRLPAFSDLYRKLALPTLGNQVRNKAAATLRRLTRR
jgi:hypothetical protein